VEVLGDTYYVLDADSIELRDYSPGHDGHHPLLMTPQLLQQAAADNDYGAARVERHMPGLEPTGPTMSTAW
jgi:hypothetical protein